MSRQLKVNDKDISSTLEHYDAIHQMLAASSWGAPMSDEHNDKSLSLVEFHVLQEVVRILKHSYS